MNIVSYVGAMVVVTGALLAVAGEKVMGLFFEKDIKHLLRNRIKQGRLKPVSDGLYIF